MLSSKWEALHANKIQKNISFARCTELSHLNNSMHSNYLLSNAKAFSADSPSPDFK